MVEMEAVLPCVPIASERLRTLEESLFFEILNQYLEISKYVVRQGKVGSGLGGDLNPPFMRHNGGGIPATEAWAHRLAGAGFASLPCLPRRASSCKGAILFALRSSWHQPQHVPAGRQSATDSCHPLGELSQLRTALQCGESHTCRRGNRRLGAGKGRARDAARVQAIPSVSRPMLLC